MNMHERIMAGKLFTDMCEGMPQERDEAKKRMIAFNATTPDTLEERLRIQKEMLHPSSGDAWIEPPFYFCYGRHIIMGEGTYVNFNCNFVDDGMITVGKNVLFGPAVTIATVGHPIRPDMREYMYTDPVTICDNVWIGENVTICPGVTIGENSVIGAGSVVVKDIPANVIAVGNPCRVLREIGEKDMEFYYRDRKIDPEDLKEEAELRKGIKVSGIKKL
ncbi:MAG: galactoside O-acetyltransferase [Clostridia bacterium]|nr:galactoside O-acetyltransferase [Clostridia bacterium]